MDVIKDRLYVAVCWSGQNVVVIEIVRLLLLLQVVKAVSSKPQAHCLQSCCEIINPTRTDGQESGRGALLTRRIRPREPEIRPRLVSKGGAARQDMDKRMEIALFSTFFTAVKMNVAVGKTANN